MIACSPPFIYNDVYKWGRKGNSTMSPSIYSNRDRVLYRYYYELFRIMRGPTIYFSKLTHGTGGRKGGGGEGTHEAVVVYKPLLSTDVNHSGIGESGRIFLAGD